ncbi:MAG: hypothetical protein MRZ79_20525 [Bacteroidia bacterium]|nr:hypothetical protein [Bacteroidia bacterium]
MMRIFKYTQAIFLSLILFLPNLSAQISINSRPAGWVYGNYALGVEKEVRDNFSIELEAQFRSANSLLISLGEARPIGRSYGATAIGKYYFNQNTEPTRNGVFIGPWVRYTHRRGIAEEPLQPFQHHILSTGTLMGIKYDWNWFYFELDFGPGFFLYNLSIDQEGNRRRLSDLDPEPWFFLSAYSRLAVGHRF